MSTLPTWRCAECGLKNAESRTECQACFAESHAMLEQKENKKEKERYSFSICSFNVWCPFFNETGNYFELRCPDIWRQRHRAILDVLDSMNADIVCLQEFWCDNNEFVNLYEEHFKKRNYFFHVLRRSAASKPDGIAILIKKSVFWMQSRFDLSFCGKDRVAMMVGVKHRKSGSTMSIGNSHFSFSTKHNKSLRRAQCLQYLDLMQTKTSKEASAMIICGDFNCDLYGEEGILCLNRKYKSSYHGKHGVDGHAVSHLNHRRESVFVDHIFYKNTKNEGVLEAVDSYLYPRTVSPSKWPSADDWCLSDHRPLVTTFEF